jgi:hypothetical protein
VRSPERPLVFLQDEWLEVGLPNVALGRTRDRGLGEVLCRQEHGHLVGWVKDEAKRSALATPARGVPGLLSIAVYLPPEPAGEDAPSSATDLTLKAKVVPAIVVARGAERTNVAVEVLGARRSGDWPYKLDSGKTSEYGRYVKFLRGVP